VFVTLSVTLEVISHQQVFGKCQILIVALSLVTCHVIFFCNMSFVVVFWLPLPFP
jgi:hypothetical protein